MTRALVDRIGLPAKPAGPGHNKAHMICHHWDVYRLTCAEYEDLRAFAGGRCGICKTPEAETRRGRLVIDHFHGRNGASFIRGMLCDWCNQSVMQCADGLKPWNAVNRQWEAAARAYEQSPWEKPSDEALRQMAARTEKVPQMPSKSLPDRSRLNAIVIPARRGVPAMADRLRAYLTDAELASLAELLIERVQS